MTEPSSDRPLVVQLITRMILGGAQLVCLSAAKGLRLLGWNTEIWAGPPVGAEGDLLFEARRAGLTVRIIPEMRRRISPHRDLRAYLHLCELMREHRPTVVHTHSSKAGVLGRFAARATDIPAVVHTVHGLPFGYGRWIPDLVYPSIERAAARRCDAILSVSASLVARLRGYKIAPEQLVTQLNWGVDLSRYGSCDGTAVRARYGFRPAEPVILVPARLSPDKGHLDILKAVAKLVGQYDDIVLLLVGDGPLRDHIAAMAESLGIAANVVMTGRVPPSEMPNFFAAADIVALSSSREGLPLVLVEAYMAGKPCVAYDVDGVGEIVRDGVSGRLLMHGDIDGFAAALASLLSEPSLRTSYGVAGREFVSTRFGEDRMCAALDEVYREVLRKKKQ
jgi:glycosyltransferase involved in cell wall biosynthesis